jgi:hypothetical protein
LVLVNGLHEESANELQGSLMFKKNGLDEGIKYLGFMLKPNDYDFRDWMWLYVKIQKRIMFWVHRWLSRGGILVLLNSVLSKYSSILGSYCKNSKRNPPQNQETLLPFLMGGKFGEATYPSGQMVMLGHAKRVGWLGNQEPGLVLLSIGGQNLMEDVTQ